MSVEATTWVWDHSTAQPIDRFVLMCLADYADKAGANARPSATTISKRTGLSERQVRQSLSDLRASGAIEATGVHKSGVTIYQIQMPLHNVHPPAQRAPLHNVHPPPAQRAPEPPLNHPVGVSNETPTRRPRARDPIWDVMEEIFGVVPPKTNAHGKRNKSCGDLRAFGATDATIRSAARRWEKVYPNATMTDTALATHYGTLHVNGHKPSVECPHCGTLPSTIRLSDHLADVHGEL